MNKHDDLTQVYRKLAKRIDAETVGCECTRQETEITVRGITFWVFYNFTREYLGTHSSYDEEPSGKDITSLRIEEWNAFDKNGDTVSVTFDPSQIEEYFNTPDYLINHRDER
jgi:hypothetical protein